MSNAPRRTAPSWREGGWEGNAGALELSAVSALPGARLLLEGAADGFPLNLLRAACRLIARPPVARNTQHNAKGLASETVSQTPGARRGGRSSELDQTSACRWRLINSEKRLRWGSVEAEETSWLISSDLSSSVSGAGWLPIALSCPWSSHQEHASLNVGLATQRGGTGGVVGHGVRLSVCRIWCVSVCLSAQRSFS